MRVFLRFKQLPIVILNVKCVNTNIDVMYINPDTSLVKWLTILVLKCP